MTATGSLPAEATDLLGQVTSPLEGLYRRHPQRNLAAIGTAIAASYRDEGPVRLGRRRSLVVVAVDGLGYGYAHATLTSATLSPLISEFPTTTVACLMTSVTGERADHHGFVGVQYLHADGRSLVNCHDGSRTGSGQASARPTRTPELSTIFDTLAGAGVAAFALPAELGGLHPDARDRLLHGARIIDPARTRPVRAGLPARADPVELVTAFGARIDAALAAAPGAMVWAYLDLDSHIHAHGFDQRAAAAMTALDALASRWRDGGTSVLIFSDHGLSPSAPSADTNAAWQAAASERWCRLPPGGAGRVRWLYPHPRRADRLGDQLAGQFADAVVVTSDQIAELGFVTAGSVGQRRLGEIILMATGPDFPVPDARTAYEHGSMTAQEVLIPMAIWSAD